MKKRKRRMSFITCCCNKRGRLKYWLLAAYLTESIYFFIVIILALVSTSNSSVPHSPSALASQQIAPSQVARVMVITRLNDQATNLSDHKISRFLKEDEKEDLSRPTDLAAIDSSRILSIGRPSQPIISLNPQSSAKLAPYASNISASSHANILATRRENRTAGDVGDDAQVIREVRPLHNDAHQQLQALSGVIYRPTAPVFIRQPPSRSNLRFLYPNASAINEPSIPTIRTTTAIQDLAWVPPVPARPIYLLGPRQVIVPQTSARPTLAPPLAKPSWLIETSPNPRDPPDSVVQKLVTNFTDIGTKSLTANQELEHEFEAREENKVDGSVTEIKDPDARNMSARHQHARRKFPSGVLSWVPINSEDDAFERHLKSGSYQRTSPATNMSWTQILRQATESSVMESLIVTNTSMVSLLCETDDMLVRLRFRKPFYGRLAAAFDKQKLSGCRLLGNGGQFYEMRVPLNDCGTKRESPRLFVNNILIQYHQSPTTTLDLADDELKTIICSYPIKPRVQPPGQTENPNSTLSERIIEAPKNDTREPAKLSQVYFEPFLLISGLVVFALALLGLTTSAYMFVKRRRQLSSLSNIFGSPRSSRHTSSISGRIYRRAPAQLANTQRWLAPPLIGAPKIVTPVRPVTRTSQGKSSAATNTQAKRQNSRSPKPLIAKPPRRVHKLIEKRHQNSREQPIGESDSLVDDSKSVTTVEISYSKNKYSEEHKTTEIISAPLTKPAKQNQTQSKAVQAEDDAEAVPFSSIRATLTSPSEFRRLQEIARLFDSILVENQVDRGGDRTIVYTTSRLRPSKYKNRILDVMDEQELYDLSSLLRSDEVFRSLVIESSNEEIFKRKLRDHPKYSNKLKPATWRLLRDVLLDPSILGDKSQT